MQSPLEQCQRRRRKAVCAGVGPRKNKRVMLAKKTIMTKKVVEKEDVREPCCCWPVGIRERDIRARERKKANSAGIKENEKERALKEKGRVEETEKEIRRGGEQSQG